MATQCLTEQGHLPRDLYKDWKYGGVRCEDIDWKNRIFTFICNGETYVYDENDAENTTSTKRKLIDDVIEHVKKKAVEMSVVVMANPEEKPTDNPLVKSTGIWAPQNYLGLVTGMYYCLKHDKPPVSEIKMLLKAWIGLISSSKTKSMLFLWTSLITRAIHTSMNIVGSKLIAILTKTIGNNNKTRRGERR